MNFIEKYREVIKELREISNPIIKYKIDKEIYEMKVEIEDYVSLSDPKIKYWINGYNKNMIHGSKDSVYENTITKLLNLGLSKNNIEFNNLFSYLLEDKYWQDDSTFEGILMKTVIYPFLIRAGYYDNENINNFFYKRLSMIETAIDNYGYDIEETCKKPNRYSNSFIFKYDYSNESLPTIYDLYAFAYYPKNNIVLNKRIEKIVEYLLDDRFQQIPKKAYIYDSIKKRYYAAGNVYHACLTEERMLLTIHLLSHFKAIKYSKLFNDTFNAMFTQDITGFFILDKKLIKEKKDSYHLYSGNHMGLGEKRTNKNWLKIESTLWMLKILLNIDKNNIDLI